MFCCSVAGSLDQGLLESQLRADPVRNVCTGRLEFSLLFYDNKWWQSLRRWLFSYASILIHVCTLARAVRLRLVTAELGFRVPGEIHSGRSGTPVGLSPNFFYSYPLIIIPRLLHIYHRPLPLAKQHIITSSTKTSKLHGLSPQANYTDRATAACRRS
jgi:hypothetical protein